MNRMLGWLALDGSEAKAQRLEACPYISPHWNADHHSIYVEGAIALSATQRLITPECRAGLMPYRDNSSGCVINADVYLTNREELYESLGSDPQSADAVIILQAYLKWGEQCTVHLAGQFCFMIWDPRHRHLFVAVDQFAQCPLFFVYRAREFFMTANECSAFHSIRPGLTLNSQRLVEFAKDMHSATETAYQEIHKLPPGHQMIVTATGLRQINYWRWKDHRQKLPYQSREEFYEAAQSYFERAVKKCLRRLGPLTTQLSGGLDSSAVTAQAALLLAKQQQSLTAFTILPHGLAGKSYRSGWYYHELPMVETLLKRHSNIQHLIYRAKPSTDIFEKLKPLQRCFDQPLRNINNLDWSLACYEQVLAQQGRVLLIGAGGNGTISWEGQSVLENINSFYLWIKAKARLRRRRWIPKLHESMLSGRLTAPLRASVYALQLWYGVRRLDPTQDLNLAVFCYNVPQWIYRRGSQPLQRRLLTREGLGHLLPKEIAQNPYRGEQGADWYLHYNLHRKAWRAQLNNLPPTSQAILWRAYDRQKIMALFDDYPFLDQPPDRKTTQDLCYQLLRCLSVGNFLKNRQASDRISK